MLRTSSNDSCLTTAALLKRELEDGKLGISELDGESLRNFYQGLSPITPPDFSRILNIFDNFTPFTPNNTFLSGVMIETRLHPNIKRVVDNFFKNLDCQLVFCFGRQNSEYVKDTFAQEFRGNIILQELNCNAINASIYNAILLSERFWNALASRGKILTIQTDSWISEFSDYTIDSFMEFDFIGSAYSRMRPIGIVADGGNGGFSLRDWHKSVACIKKFNPEYWRGGEDGYFNFHIDLLGGKVGDFDSCTKFGSQGLYRHNSWGFHQPSLLPLNVQKKIIQKEPELAAIISSGKW